MATQKRKYREAFTESVDLFSDHERPTNFETFENVDNFLSKVENCSSGVILMGTASAVDTSERMILFVNAIAKRFPELIFIQVDVDKHKEMSNSQKLEMIPTFVAYKNGKPVGRVEGAFPDKLLELLSQVSNRDLREFDDIYPSEKFGDLTVYVNLRKCEARNTCDTTKFEDFLAKKCHIKSDCDEQLLMTYGFNQDVKVAGLKLVSSKIDNAPNYIKIFTNQLNSLDFDDVESLEPTFEIKISEKILREELIVDLPLWKFSKVSNLTIFVPGNHGNSDVTEINELVLLGEPVVKKRGICGRSVTIANVD